MWTAHSSWERQGGRGRGRGRRRGRRVERRLGRARVLGAGSAVRGRRQWRQRRRRRPWELS
uniref:Uncharacterized protein n=1 Tax=Arundo donax TaxID=35708 RepID=A0A0A9HRK2_ARUDO